MLNDIKFYLRVKEECDRLGMSVNKVERELGYPRNALHNYKAERIPSGKRLIELSEYFGVTPNYLLGYSEGGHGDTRDLFNKLSIEEKKEIYCISQEWVSSMLFKRSKKF